jgi:membrane-associated protease RseP (regulator of RpoE activity)
LDNDTPAGSRYPFQEPAFEKAPLHDLADWRPMAPPRRVRFQHRLRRHIILLIITLATTTFAGSCQYASFASDFSRRTVDLDPAGFFLSGLWYSLTLLLILGSHEMGHYLLCRKYNVDATLPYFLPAPLLTGTLGAVIRIREPFPTRAALFDIGVAGPIAGFVALVPALFIGLWLSRVTLAPPPSDALFALGEPLLFQWGTWLVFGTLPAGHTINMHPMVFAAWFGMLATALNLLPFGQLDGGHITYSTLGRWATPISLVTVLGAVIMTVVSTSWVFITVMMLAMLVILGPRHPPVLYHEPRLGTGRTLVAILAVVMFALCFTPTPIEPYDLIPATQTQQASR